MDEIRIDPILEATLHPHSDKLGQEFEKMLVDQGEVYDPIWTWNGLIVDGHHRYRVAIKNGLRYTTREVFPDAKTLEDVQFEMRRAQAYKRNLTPAERAETCYAIVAHLTGKGMKKNEAIDEAASATGVSRRQVFRDLQHAKTVEECAPKLSPLVASVAPTINELNTKDLKTFANLPHADQDAIIEKHEGDIARIEKELSKSRVVPKPPVKEVFGEADPRQVTTTEIDKERAEKRPMVDNITDAMQMLGELNKQVAKCKSMGTRRYNDCRLALRKIDEVLEEWLDECERTLGIK